MLPIVLDIEASGLGRNSYPIEIGLVMPDGQQHCFLVRPEPQWTHWDPSAQRLHGISQDQLQAEGHSVWQVASELNELLAGETVYSDAWGYDMPWLAKLFDAAGLPQFFRVEAITRLLDDTSLSRWNQLKDNQFLASAFRRHRASSDAAAIQQTYLVASQGDGQDEPDSISTLGGSRTPTPAKYCVLN